MIRRLPPHRARAVAALVTARSTADAARKAGVSPRSVFRWKRSDLAFQIALEEAQAEIIRRALGEAVARIGSALAALAAIAEDEGIRPETRLRAIKTAIRTAFEVDLSPEGDE